MTGDTYFYDDRLRRLMDYSDNYAYTVVCTPSAWFKDGEDPLDPKVIRQRWQAALTTLRGREPEFLPPVWCPPGKRVARRWGSRAREQRDRKLR